MLLNLLVLYTFIIALFKKIDNFAKRESRPHFAATALSSNISTTPFELDNSTFTTDMDFVSFSPNESVENGIMDAIGTLIQGTAAVISEIVPELTTTLSTNVTFCYQVAVNCSKSSQFNRTMVTSLFILNFTTTILPELWPHLNVTNDFSMSSSSSSSSSSTMAYTDETFDWMDYNTTTDSDYNSSTTMTSNSLNFFNYSTTDAYDTTTISESTDTKLSDRDYELESTTANAVDEYEYDYEEPSKRRRKKRSNDTIGDYSDYTYDEDIDDSVEVTISTTFDDMNATFASIIFDDNTTTDDYNNHTEFISSTIASFIANVTSTDWPDEMNTTYASELWTEYVTTLNSSLTDDYYVDENENESDKMCYVTRCEVIEKDEEGDATTPTISSTTLTSTKATTKAITSIPNIVQPTPKAPTCPPPNLSSAIFDLLPTTVSSSGNETRHGNLTGLYIDQRKYCWETMFGQELVKLTVLDLVRLRSIQRFLSIAVHHFGCHCSYITIEISIDIKFSRQISYCSTLRNSCREP